MINTTWQKFITACKDNDIKGISNCLQQEGFIHDTKDNNTPLRYALLIGVTEIATLILTKDDNYPLYNPSKIIFDELLKVLNHTPSLFCKTITSHGENAETFQSKLSDQRGLYLISLYKSACHVQIHHEGKGFSALDTEQGKQLESILQQPINVNIQDTEGHSILFYAVLSEDHFFIATLLKHYDNICPDLLEAALGQACKYNSLPSIKALLDSNKVTSECIAKKIASYHSKKHKQNVLATLIRYPSLDMADTAGKLANLYYKNKGFSKMKIDLHEMVAEKIILLIDKIIHPHHLLQLLDGIGIGNIDEKTKDELPGKNHALHPLRYRSMDVFGFNLKKGYRETNDSKKIAEAIFKKAEDLLNNKEGKDIDYNCFKKIFDRNIERRPSKKSDEARQARLNACIEDNAPMHQPNLNKF